jgi:hypothetical protein
MAVLSAQRVPLVHQRRRRLVNFFCPHQQYILQGTPHLVLHRGRRLFPWSTVLHMSPFLAPFVAAKQNVFWNSSASRAAHIAMFVLLFMSLSLPELRD